MTDSFYSLWNMTIIKSDQKIQANCYKTNPEKIWQNNYIFVDRATPHHSKITKRFLAENKDTIRLEYLPVGSPEFNAVEECWRQGKYNILSCYYNTFDSLKEAISSYYRTIKFNLNIVQYLTRTID